MSATAEQIVLDSNEQHSISPREEDLNTVILELRQTDKLHDIQQAIQVYESHVINVTEKHRKRNKSFMINLALLNDKPVRVTSINPKLLIGALAMALLTYLTYYLKSKGVAFLASSYSYAAIALLATSSVIAFIMTARSFTNAWAFETKLGRIPIVTLYHNNPNKAQFQQFLNEFINSIMMAKSEKYLSDAQMIPLEVGEHRRLRDEGIISKAQYEQAKTNILQGKSQPG